MYLKRQMNGDQVVGVQVLHTGTTPEQNFSRRLVLQGMSAGFIELDGKKLKLKADPDTLIYEVKREPGYYCKSNGKRIPISQLAWEQAVTQAVATLAAAEAQAWLAGAGKKRDDYEVTMAYECVLDAEQHSKWRAVRDIAGNPVAAHTQEG